TAPAKLYCGNLCRSRRITAARAWFSCGDSDEIVFPSGDDLDGDDVAGAKLLFVAGDEDEAVHVGGVGAGAADEDVAFAFDALVENYVERAADLLLIAG